MKPFHLLIGLLVLLASGSCSDSIEEPISGPNGNTGSTDVYHDYIRQNPYPKADNELFLNPPPLIVPEQLRNRDERLQFALSRSAGFEPQMTEVSNSLSWCMYNPHRALESGTWYWRFRVVDANGEEQPWSETYRFTVTDDLPRFVTPTAEHFFNHLPVGHPRLYGYLDSQAEAARPKLPSHPEYKSLKSRANTALRQDFTHIATFYRDKASTESLNNYTNYLFQAYYLTREENYAAKMLEILSQMTACPPADSQLFASNFITTNIALAYIRIYDLLHTDRNLSLSFRSSPYGCSQHTFANQNAFNVLYKGVDVFRNTGYYLKYASPHHIMSYRHTRAHNTLLVNGIGQSFTPRAYGSILRGIDGDHISYCLGDASNAYADTCDLKVWIENFKEAGISQTPANGFGATPLTGYLRHVWMLHPDIIVIYDELEASEPVRWDWLLHSPSAFHVEQDGFTLHTADEAKGFSTQAQLFSGQRFQISQTDRFTVPPVDSPDPAYPNRWHLNATVKDSRANRFLFIMQVHDRNEEASPVYREGNDFKINGWHIHAELNPDRSPAVTITHDVETVMFSYGTGSVPLPDGNLYERKQPFSSVVYDTRRGKPLLQEETDFLPKHTRTAGVRR